MKNGRKSLFVVLLSYLFIDAISSSSRSDYTHKRPISPYWLTNGKKTKTYGLAGLSAPLRQGRSLSLPTLPYQQTNRYAVDGAKPVLVSFRLCIGYTNRYVVTNVMPVFVSLRLRISHTNRYAVVGTTPLICAYTVMGCLLL